MKVNLIYLFLSFFLACCSTPEGDPAEKIGKEVAPLKVPLEEVDKSELAYNPKKSLWTLDSVPFSGYSVTYNQDSILIQKFGILDGRKQNEALDWYADGRIRYLSNYHQGRLHGEKKVWSKDSTHILLAHYNYHLGKAHGVQKQWYPTGELFKVRQMINGKEEGIQQAFRKNGELYSNYEAREGRIFGLKKATLCYGLEDGEIKQKEEKEEKVIANN